MIEQNVLRILNRLFDLLYHGFAWTYDFIAALVSLGLWKSWVFSTTEWVSRGPVLEIGFGPGHLQSRLAEMALHPIGVDESPQMCRIAKKRLQRTFPAAQNSLIRSVSQNLPFASEHFQIILSTFPSEYIFDPQTMTEAHRVLARGGVWVILLSASLPDKTLFHRLLKRALFLIGYDHPENNSPFLERWSNQLRATGFQLKIERIVDNLGSRLVVEAQKK